MSGALPLLLVCGSVMSSPDPTYLSHLRSTFIHDSHLFDLRDQLLELEDLWSLLVTKNPSFKRVGAASLLRALTEWLVDGNSSALLSERQSSRNTRAAVLTVLAHIIEYASYLNQMAGAQHQTSDHTNICAEALARLQDGGVQGLCIGLLSAIAIACSQTKSELSQYAAIALRLALCVGVVVDLDEIDAQQSTVCLSARWSRNEGDYEGFEEVVKSFPEAYVSVRTDASSATITTHEGIASILMSDLESRGALVKRIDIKGRFHDQRHLNAFNSLAELCASLPMLQFPKGAHPLAPLRRNDTGEVVVSGVPLHEMALECILVKKADWHSLVKSSVESLAANVHSECKSGVLTLGPIDCIPRSICAILPLQTFRPVPSSGLQSYSDDSIAIVGSSYVFPGSESPEKLWDVLMSKGTPESLSGVGEFDHTFFRKSPREADYMDPQQRLALQLAHGALESGGYFSPSSSTTDNIGCYIGVSSSDYQEHVDARPPTAFSFTGTARAFGSGRVSHFFGLTGPSIIIDTACSSSGVAIHTACKAIQSGDCSMALAGGINLMTMEAKSHHNLQAASFLSPTGQCRPFDAAADGYRRGEGGGLILLKKLSEAVRDNNNIMGVIAASAVNNSKGNRSITLPSSESQSQLYRRVLKMAGMQPHQVSYVEAHGTGTQKGDPIEYQSIQSVFSSHDSSSTLNIGSIKANLGHAEAASGVASLSKVLLMLQHHLIPPQANFTTLNPNITSAKDKRIQIAQHPEVWGAPFKAALVNNYGASGANAAMLLCQPPLVHPDPSPFTTQPLKYPILVCAHSEVSLREYCRSILRFIDTNHDLGETLLSAIAFHLAQRQNQSLSRRLAFSVRSIGELKERLNAELQGFSSKAQKLELNPKRVVLVFSGQTGRRPQLDREVYLGSHLLRLYLGQCDRAFQSLGLTSLFPTIFGSEPLYDLVDLHCIQFSLQFSLARAWIDSGLEVETLVGHSLGQLTALCVSGAASLRDTIKLISGRARLIQRHWGPERGCMLSVDTDAASVHDIISSLSTSCTVEVACYNSLSNHVVVGTEAAIGRFQAIACSKEISTKQLPITHAFHSEMIDGIMDQYYKLLQEISLKQPTIPIEPCSEHGGRWENPTPELIARQSREPVFFDHAVSRIERRLGPCVWVEAGPSVSGITLARRALVARRLSDSHSFYALRLQNSDSLNSLADTTIDLWDEGIRVQYWLYHSSERYSFRPLQLPAYHFEKYQHWLPAMPRSQSPGESDMNQHAITQAHPELISPLGKVNPDMQVCEFSINQLSNEYSSFVKGRTVFEKYLTPSSVYIEAAGRAFSSLYEQGSSSMPSPPPPIEVEQIKIHAPFGLDLKRKLLLRLEKQKSTDWSFAIKSYLLQDGNKSSKLLVSGVIKGQKKRRVFDIQRPLLRHLHDQCLELCQDRDASVFQGPLAKRILGRVAKYQSTYFGIRSVTCKGLRAVGDVSNPEIASRISPQSIFSPPVFDNFLLVAELHASSIGELSSDELYICNGFNAINLQSSEQSLSSSRGPWLVLSTMDYTSDETITSDIIVFNAHDKSRALSILGAGFTKISARSLKRTLQAMDNDQSKRVASPNNSGRKPRVGFPETTVSFSGVSEMYHPSAFDEVRCVLAEQASVQESMLGKYSVPNLSGLPSMYNSRDASHCSSKAASSPRISNVATPTPESALLSLLADHLDCSQEISPRMPLGQIGLDSLVSIQLQSDIEKEFGKSLDLMTVNENTTFSELCDMVLHQSFIEKPSSGPWLDIATDCTPMLSSDEKMDGSSEEVVLGTNAGSSPHVSTDFVTCATKEFACLTQNTNMLLQQSGFAGFFTEVYPKQRSLVLAYVLEAFSSLGCNLKENKVGEQLHPISYMPKYEKLIDRLYGVLEEEGLVCRRNNQIIRTSEPVLANESSERLHEEILTRYPAYEPDHKLLNVTGSRLADCLSGKADPLQLLFQDKASFSLLEDVYVSSPMFATGNKILGDFIRRISMQFRHSGSSLRILEIGAGTGGTTRLVLDQLLHYGIKFTYTFTDISSALVTGSQRKFNAQYGQSVNMEFTVLDIEKPPPPNILHSYDLILSSNCIHATRDLGLSCANMHKLLREDGGMLCLLELTRPLGWLDCVFGLLDGWWRFDDGRKYALADETYWKSTLLGAGFIDIHWTDDGTLESEQFRLITALRPK